MISTFLVGALMSSSFAATDAVPKIPLREFFKNPAITGFQLSPDGKKLAYLKPWENRLNLFMREINSTEETRLTSLKDRDLAGFFWKGNSYILYSRDFGGDENFHIFSLDLKTKKETDLTPWPKVRASIEDDLEDISADEILLSHNQKNAEVFDVYRYNLKTGKSKIIAQNNGKIVGWMTDHKGKLRLAVETDGVNQTILYRDTEAQKFAPLMKTSFKESFSPVLFTFDNKNLYVLSNINRDKISFVEYDLKAKKESHILYQNPSYDISGFGYSKKRKVLTRVSYSSWKNQSVFFDTEAEQIYQKLADLLPNREVRAVSQSKDEQTWIVRTFTDKSKGAFYIYDVKKNALTELAQLSENLPEKYMADMKPIEYTSRDGLKIEGYLTLPVGIPAKKLPVIVNPHGGPWVRDHWGFNSEAQWLANRGYAVLQMNYRGSTGYGKAFWQSSFKQWGRKMQDDITDGVQWLIAQGIANPKKVGIYGGSYGGYATLAGLAFTPDVYAVGVDYVGVSNLFTFLTTIPPYWKPMLDQMYEMVGHPEKDKDLLTAASPVFHVDQIRAPLLIAQGAKDPRVNKAESDQIVEALRKRKIEVPYLVKENEGHGFHNEENRFDFYETMEKFLDKHLK